MNLDTALWYTSRATGVVCLLQLTGVVILGVLVTRQGRLPGLPKFAVTGLHRNLSLLAVIFLVIHVVTAIVDPLVTIGWAAAVIPPTSGYRPLWMGLGAVALDLLAAVIVTSLIRVRLGRRTWRAVHWLAYACWPVALVHSLGSSGDMQSGPLLWLAALCTCAVAGAVAVRLLGWAREVPQEHRPAALLAREQRLARQESLLAGEQAGLAREHAALMRQEAAR